MPSARHGAAQSIDRAMRLGEQPLVLVRTVTGLERLTAAELTAARHRVIGLSKRQLVVEPAAATLITEPPRLADDLFVVQAVVPDPGRTRAGLVAAVVGVRGLVCPVAGDFAVSASFQGPRNYNRFDIEDLVGGVLGELSRSDYHSRRDGTRPPADRVDWRVVLDGTAMWVGVRPFDVPLHRREWRRRTVAGSLHPPVAAAMARLAEIAPGDRVLDPFCGAGTLLLEADAISPDATYVGIDRSPEAVAAARANTGTRGHIHWRTGDARHLPVRVDRIVTNPPWGVRVAIGDLTPYLNQWHRTHAGRVVTILNQHQAETMITNPTWRILDTHNLTVAGQHPQIIIAEPT
ncbi:methyltransferase domain-containing protein [Kribbella turkmenica]|uniref:Methyltransferase domain-containing protein n=1 Tax=Kribbella turkmenica TaxID=2530375 RepID=A0A4V2YHD2_9ACTN|nr:methyltransferase domain-containing protein [Kribbella turkmenica]TDD30587.1 methyltransferase domain-containing protein [Kribbella turkmenica]